METQSFKIKATGKEIVLSSSEIRRLLREWSVSKLRDFVDCPLHFYFKRIVKVHKNPKMDIRPKPLLILGTVLHTVMHRFFSKKMVNGFKSPKSVSGTFIEMWNGFIKGEDIFGVKREWDWKGIAFKNKKERDIFMGKGILACRNFWHKNIHYFKQKEKYIRPLPEVYFADDYFGPDNQYKLIGKMDRIELIKRDNGDIDAYIIDYKSGSGYGLTSEYLEKDWQFMIYQWLYILHYRMGNIQKSPAPLKGMYIYPLSAIQGEGPLDLNELKRVPLSNANKLSRLEKVIVDAESRLKMYLEYGDFPAHPNAFYCGNICPFEKQCNIYLGKHKQVNARYKKMDMPFSKTLISSEMLVRTNQKQKSKQMKLKLKYKKSP